MATHPPAGAPANDPEPIAARSHAMSALLARNWGWVLFRGILALAFGLLAIALPGATLASLVLLFSAYMIADGILAIVSAVRVARAHERWGWLLFEGVIDIAAGVVAFLMPFAAVVTLALLASIWATFTGVTMLVAAFRLRVDHGRWWLALSGLLSIVWGVLLFIFPAAAVLVMTLWLGAYAAAFGIALIVLAFRLRSRCPPISGPAAPVQG